MSLFRKKPWVNLSNRWCTEDGELITETSGDRVKWDEPIIGTDGANPPFFILSPERVPNRTYLTQREQALAKVVNPKGSDK